MLIEKQTKKDLDSSLTKDIIRSYNNYYELNNYNQDIGSKEHDTLWDILDVNELYTVFQNDRFLGFFIIKIHDKNNEVSFQIFLSPVACPKGNMTLIKAGMSKCFLMFIEQPTHFKHFEFVSGHPILVTTVKTLLPKTTSYMITPNHIVCYKEIKLSDLLFMKGYIETYTKTNNNYNSYELLR